jgi:RecB family endonuclease NucS
MTGLWKSADGRWELASPVGFEDEARLHSLVEEAPHLLPLSGSPQVIVGREVTVGSGSIDLVAIEASGRPVIIEVKLARNAEARRAVVAQALSYAAHLNGLTANELEGGTLANHLDSRG